MSSQIVSPVSQQETKRPASKGPSVVTEVAPAPSKAALAHYSKKFEYETDCADVHVAIYSNTADFVVLDVRSLLNYAKGHVPGALNLMTKDMSEKRMRQFPSETVFVVYCSGPHCNGSTKAAIRLAELGRPVKEMIGGITGWRDEKYREESS